MKNCLVIGYGSIGKRHSEVLLSLGHNVSIVSRHLNSAACDLPVYCCVKDAFTANKYDYILIASSTKEHIVTLQQILPYLTETSVCFIEKPIFSSPEDWVNWGNAKICTGYVLRGHPLLRKIKDILTGKKIYSCRASCGQYLPSWRPGTDYTKCYSAYKEQGGGVLRDLSHELDYMQMLCGKWKKVTAIGGKFSDLAINSDDQYGILFSAEKCPLCMCHIDYLSRDTHRTLSVEYEGGSLKLDFLNGTLLHNGIKETVSLERNDLFKTMHSELINYDLTYFPSGKEAYEIVKLIDAAEKTAGKDIWIENR
ncbi:MAG: Gfo/Idh/MocA family oxidoreductase [Lentisphaeria bacterium]|nr:Gfo/Idh/MocA family oxidoreductase [Lentisphaeria bacterium]